MGIINQRNYRKFLKAFRTENPFEVLINVFKRISRTLFKSYQRERISFNGALPAVLWILPNVPQKDKSSGERRLHYIFELLAPYIDLYIFTEGERKTALPSSVVLIPEMSPDQLQAQQPYFQYLIFSWFTTYEDLKIFRTLYPHSTTIIDSVDLHWIRETRAVGSLKGLTHHDAADTKRRELQAYREVDQIWVVTDHDRKTLKKELSQSDIQVISNVHAMNALRQNFPKDKKMLFVGSFRHYPNIKAAEYLAQIIFPEILSAHPNAQLIIAGAHPPAAIQSLGETPQVFVTGYLSDESLWQLYQEVSVTIVPLFAGSGIKGKICEAIAHGVPVITNDIGNEGINLIHQKEALIIPNEKMAEEAIALLNGDYNTSKMIRLAQDKLAQLVAPHAVKKHLLQQLFPTVTIGIVTHNRLDLLKVCIDSILQNTRYPFYQIHIYSNACSDGTPEYLRALAAQEKRIEFTESKSNEVFVRPNNWMIQQAGENEMVLLNNDTTVAEGWLLALYAAAYSSPDYGIAGAKILYPDGTLQEFGAEMKLTTGIGFNRGKGENASAEEYKGIRPTGYVSGCAMYLKRSTIHRVGLLDEQFHPCYFEDADYCYTARNKGLLTVVTAHAIVYHHEGATSGQDESSGMKQYQAINREKFIAKHGVKS